MGELKELYTLQKIALSIDDFASLNAINQKIYELREQRRKAKQKAKEQEQDNKTAEKIENTLNK